MIDDMQGIFTHASEAFRAGKRRGREDAFSAALSVLGLVSAKHEREENPAAFHAAEECCKVVRELWNRAEKRREIV